MKDLIPPETKWTVDQARKKALEIYDSFYTYSDEKFDKAYKYKSIRVLYKFFYQTSPYIQSLISDPKKEPYLQEFYVRCCRDD